MSCEPVPEWDWVSFVLEALVPIQRRSRAYQPNHWFNLWRRKPVVMRARNTRLCGVQLKYVGVDVDYLLDATTTPIYIPNIALMGSQSTYEDVSHTGFNFDVTVWSVSPLVGVAANTHAFKETITFATLRDLHLRSPNARPLQVLAQAAERVHQQARLAWL